MIKSLIYLCEDANMIPLLIMLLITSTYIGWMVCKMLFGW